MILLLFSAGGGGVAPTPDAYPIRFDTRVRMAHDGAALAGVQRGAGVGTVEAGAGVEAY